MENNLVNWKNLIIRPDKKDFHLSVDKYVNDQKTEEILHELDTWIGAFLLENISFKDGDLIAFPQLKKDKDEYSDEEKFFHSITLSSRPTSDVEKEGVKMLLLDRLIKFIQPSDNIFGTLVKLTSYLNVEIKFNKIFIKHLQNDHGGLRDKWINYLSNTASSPEAVLSVYKRDEYILQSLMLVKNSEFADFDEVNMSDRTHLRVKDIVVTKLSILAQIDIKSFVDFLVRCRPNEVRSVLFLYLSLSHHFSIIEAASDYLLSIKKRNVEQQKVLYFFILELIDYVKEVEGSVRWCIEFGEDYPRKDIWKKSKEIISDLRENELPVLLEKLFVKIYKDETGKEILRDLLIYLVHQRLYFTLAKKNNEWNAEQIAYEMILKVFKDNKYTAGHLINEAKLILHNPLGKIRYNPENLLLAAIDLDLEDEKKFNSELWQWYKDLLQKKAQGLLSHVRMFSTTPDWVFHTVGAMIINEVTPIEKIVEIWNSLYSQRFFYRFRTYETELLDASVHMLRSIRGSLDILISNPDYASVNPKDLWHFCAKFEYYMTTIISKNNLIGENSNFVTTFCYVPHIFKENWAIPLKDYLELLRDDFINITKIASSLIANGISADAVKKSFLESGIDLKASFELTYDWHTALGFPNNFEVLLEDLKKQLLI